MPFLHVAEPYYSQLIEDGKVSYTIEKEILYTVLCDEVNRVIGKNDTLTVVNMEHGMMKSQKATIETFDTELIKGTTMITLIFVKI